MGTYHLTTPELVRDYFAPSKWIKLESFLTWLEFAEKADPTVRASRNSVMNRLEALNTRWAAARNVQFPANDYYVFLGDEPFKDIMVRLRTVLRSRNTENASLTNRAGVVTRPSGSDNDGAMSYFHILDELQAAIIAENLYDRAKFDLKFDFHA